ncbi:Hypothetical protein DEACI_0763, partial [Acididesulfobacillus acetoxydans]
DLSPEEFQEKLSKGEIKRFVVKV